MPKEIVTSMGIKFVPLPEEKERDKDNQLLALMLTYLPEDKQELIKDMLGKDYFDSKVRKANKVIGIYNNKGKTINISKISHSR